MTTEAPTRCCAPATSGRCNNAPAPHGQSRYIGPVEIAACNQPRHQAALRSLPGFTRRDGVCGADGCGKPIPLGLCPEHRHLYQKHGVSIRALLATEPTMPAPAPAPEARPPAPDFLDEVIAASGPGFAEKVEAAREALDRTNDSEPDTIEPSAGDVADAHPHPPESRSYEDSYEPVAEPAPPAPGPTVAELEARAIAAGKQLTTNASWAPECERIAADAQDDVVGLKTQLAEAEQRAARAELDAVAERARAAKAEDERDTLRDAIRKLWEAMTGQDYDAWVEEEAAVIPDLHRVIGLAKARIAKAEHRAHDAEDTVDRLGRYLDDAKQSRDAAIHELHEVGHALYLLGSAPDATAYEALCQILPPDRLLDLRRVEEALAAAEVARVRCRRGSADALADAIAAHASAVARLSEAEKAAEATP